MSKDIVKETKSGATVITEEAQRSDQAKDRKDGLVAEKRQADAQTATSQTLDRIAQDAKDSGWWSKMAAVAAAIAAIASVIALFKK